MYNAEIEVFTEKVLFYNIYRIYLILVFVIPQSFQHKMSTSGIAAIDPKTQGGEVDKL